jgi:GTPase
MRFIDQAEVYVKGGKGGDGMVAFRREKYVQTGGPAGGNGGKGGAVILRAVSNLQTLLDFKYVHIFAAQDGIKGGPKNLTGASGNDLVVDVPCGTVVYDVDRDECIGDLTEPGQTLVIAQAFSV